MLTRDGKLNQDANRKLKQISHFLNFLEPSLLELSKKNQEIILCDLGSGKSYLGFLIYDFFKSKFPGLKIYSIESRPDLINSCKEIASQVKFDDMFFVESTISEASKNSNLPSNIHIAFCLHACDTATDDALRFGLEKNAPFIYLVPCCQAEMARVLRENKNQMFSKSHLTEIWRHPIHTREFGAHVTNVLRCLLLQSKGYSVSVTELVGFEHSLKNELILAKFCNEKNSLAIEKIKTILSEVGAISIQDRFLY